MRKHVPLSLRPPAELRGQAERYRQMAATARTPEAKRGLESLANRFTLLADRRETEERQSRRSPDAQHMASAAD